MIEALKPNLESDDGTFWMCYDDFLKHCAFLQVLKTKTMNEVRLKGGFIRSSVERLHSKKFYLINATQKSNLIVTLH